LRLNPPPDARAESGRPLPAALAYDGGSYGEGSQQAATRAGAIGNPRGDPKRSAASGRSSEAIEPDPDQHENVKPANEPPGRPD
jgi:hypothetical protein